MIQDTPIAVKTRIIATSGELTRSDIADLLKAVGEPGQHRPTKITAVKDLCQSKGSTANVQGHPVWDTLADFTEF